jgi:thiol-disulfide isomerase/thioredoxin
MLAEPSHGLLSQMEPEPQPPEDPELAAAVAVLADVEGGAGAAKTLATLVKNLVAAPDNRKYRRVRTTNPKVRAALLDVPGGEDFLRVLGFAPSLASDEHAAGTFLEISEAAAVAVQAERGPAALAALQRVARVERVANNTAQPVAPASAPAEDAPGVEMLSKKHPTVEVSCAAAPRNGLSLQEAVAWCRSLPDCKGMWYYDNGRCCPKASWDAGTFTKEIPGGAFYRVGPAAPQAAASAPLRLMLGEELRGLGRGTVGIDAVATRDVVALYFSAHWCPPCRSFTPQLAQYYGAMWGKRPGALEVVFVSRDRDQASFEEYSDKMPWLSMPFTDDDGRRDGLASHFGVRGIPALVFINPVTCEVLLEDGRSHVMGDPQALQFPWPTAAADEASLSRASRLADAVADAAEILLPRQVTPAEVAARQEMMGRISSYTEMVLQYEDPMSQAIAMSHIPLEQLDANAGIAPGAPWGARHNSAFLRELLRWFKSDFFKWTNAPACGFCGGKTENVGMGQPSPEEAANQAGRVEVYSCKACGSQTRFPRYNKATKLLETRNGRCGEWANCFTLLCRSLGFPARMAMDWTDHVWTEVYLGAESPAAEGAPGLVAGWKHCDPCENRFDAPLLYESGWGKKLSYVVGFSCNEVVDVTPRYTNKWADQVLKRRAAIQESWLSDAIASIDVRQRSRGLGGESAAVIDGRKRAELLELRARQAVSVAGDGVGGAEKPEERGGRQTGSIEWRTQRGETGKDGAVRQCTLVPSSGGDAVTLQFTPEGTGAAAAGGGGEAAVVGALTADIVGDSPEVVVDDRPVLDLRADNSYVELSKPTCEAMGAGGTSSSFTVEAWVACEEDALSAELHNNPLISRHGVASGYELRLGAGGAACFLVTVDGEHIEVSGDAGASPGRWRHVAGVYNAESRLLQVWSGCVCVDQTVVPAGELSAFDGPLDIGACCPVCRPLQPFPLVRFPLRWC